MCAVWRCIWLFFLTLVCFCEKLHVLQKMSALLKLGVFFAKTLIVCLTVCLSPRSMFQVSRCKVLPVFLFTLPFSSFHPLFSFCLSLFLRVSLSFYLSILPHSLILFYCLNLTAFLKRLSHVANMRVCVCSEALEVLPTCPKSRNNRKEGGYNWKSAKKERLIF